MRPDIDAWIRRSIEDAEDEVRENYYEKHNRYPTVMEFERLLDQLWEDKRNQQETIKEG
jgi:hypothetical protein